MRTRGTPKMNCIWCLIKKADYIVSGNSICKSCLSKIGKGKLSLSPNKLKKKYILKIIGK